MAMEAMYRDPCPWRSACWLNWCWCCKVGVDEWGSALRPCPAPTSTQRVGVLLVAMARGTWQCKRDRRHAVKRWEHGDAGIGVLSGNWTVTVLEDCSGGAAAWGRGRKFPNAASVAKSSHQPGTSMTVPGGEEAAKRRAILWRALQATSALASRGAGKGRLTAAGLEAVLAMRDEFIQACT